MAEIAHYFKEADVNAFWASALLGSKKSVASIFEQSALAYGISLGYLQWGLGDRNQDKGTKCCSLAQVPVGLSSISAEAIL